VALVLLSLGLIHLTTILSRAHPRKFSHVASHFGTAATLIILGAVGAFRPLILIAILSLACAAQVIREIIIQLQSE
jgi:hypothetical protein